MATDTKQRGLPYRPCVGVMLLNRHGLVWVGRRVPKWEKDISESMWQMPQGGIDEGETPREAAYRELEEEIGTARAEVIAEADDWFTYDLPPEALGVALGGKYRGQKQKWFAMRFLGADEEIDIAPEGGEIAEFDSWKWVYADELTSLVVPFKRHVYEQVLRAFAPLVASR